MSESDNEDIIMQQVKRDNQHFKALLDLVPPQAYFSQEEKLEVWGNNTADMDEDGDETAHRKQKIKKSKVNPFSTLSVTQITEMRNKGGPLDVSKHALKQNRNGSMENEGAALIEAKHKGKKESRSAKAKKNKGKELQKREARLEELKERLRIKLEEIKARKMAGNAVNTQEQKKLKRQEKRVNAKLKNKTKKSKEQRLMNVAEGLRSPPQNKILNQNGVPVKSKFDFSIISFGNEKPKSELHGRDYKRLLEKVEKRKEKVEKLKEKDMEAGRKLEEKLQWQTVMSKAQGEKVKDDPNLLKRAAKRKDKVKERKQKNWGDRVKMVEAQQQKRQDKRQANIDKRKTDKKDKKRKKMIKKGRIIPGF